VSLSGEIFFNTGNCVILSKIFINSSYLLPKAAVCFQVVPE
jgi:hypothetical protein